MHGMGLYLNKPFSLIVFTCFVVILHSTVLLTGERSFASTGAPLVAGDGRPRSHYLCEHTTPTR